MSTVTRFSTNSKTFCRFSSLQNSLLEFYTALTPGNVYEQVVLKYLKKLSITGENMGPHVMRATAATNTLDNGADIAKVQEWLGHANIATTRIYDHRKTQPEDSPTFKVNY